MEQELRKFRSSSMARGMTDLQKNIDLLKQVAGNLEYARLFTAMALTPEEYNERGVDKLLATGQIGDTHSFIEMIRQLQQVTDSMREMESYLMRERSDLNFVTTPE